MVIPGSAAAGKCWNVNLTKLILMGVDLEMEISLLDRKFLMWEFPIEAAFFKHFFIHAKESGVPACAGTTVMGAMIVSTSPRSIRHNQLYRRSRPASLPCTRTCEAS